MNEQQAYNLIAQLVAQVTIKVGDAPLGVQAMQVLKDHIDKPENKE